MNVDSLQSLFEAECPNGVGYAIRLDLLSRAVAAMLQKLQNQAVNGVNRNLAFPSAGLAASFDVDTNSFQWDDAGISLNLRIWIHASGSPLNEIYSLSYELLQQRVQPEGDQTTQQVVLSCIGQAQIRTEGWGANADAELQRAQYVDAAGNPDRARFLAEAVYPFKWINAVGLLRAIVRSFPIPDLFSWFQSIRPEGVIATRLVRGHLVAWSKSASVLIPNCASTPSQSHQPQISQKTSTLGVAKPWSPFDHDEPHLLWYYAATPLLQWSAELVMPAIAFHKEQIGFPSWTASGYVAVSNITINLEPMPSGGAITFSGALQALGHATSWIEGPCGTRIDVFTATFEGPGSYRGEFSARRSGYTIRSEAVMDVDIPTHTLNLSTGGLLGGAWGEIGEWLLRVGAVKVEVGFKHRSDQVLLDVTELSNIGIRTRVAEQSLVIEGSLDGLSVVTTP
jgi:hypothetical protein